MPGKTPDPIELDYQTVFRTEAGERVLRDLMSRNFIWGGTFDVSAFHMAHNEGRRDVVLYVLDMVRKKQEPPTEYADAATQAEIDYSDEGS